MSSRATCYLPALPIPFSRAPLEPPLFSPRTKDCPHSLPASSLLEYTPYNVPKSMFTPHPNLSDDVNRAIVQSEVEGGVFLHDLPPSTILEIQTLNHCYTAVLLGGSDALLSGHPQFCPSPVQVAIAGSSWGGSMLKLRYVGRGMHLEFRHPEYATPIITSPIQEIRDHTA
jgi:hypothetical protein